LSVGDEITVSAQTKIELIGGDSSIVLKGGDITFTTLGVWKAKGSFKQFVGGANGAAELTRLPDTRVTLFDEAFQLRDPAGNALEGLPFKVTASDGAQTGESGVDGSTVRIGTQAAENLKFELRWHTLQV
jgi:type VI secretion system secreted protein VgrG